MSWKLRKRFVSNASKICTENSMYTMASILKVEQIQEWLEEHPDFKLEGALAPLKDLMFDDNPVVVIVEP